MRKIAPWFIAGMLAISIPSASRADTLIELGLAIDVSGSITTANFNLQKNAYLNVLNNPSVVPLDGSVAIGVIAFGNTVHAVFPTTVITAATIGSLITAIQNNLLDFGGSTAIGDAINYLSNQILTNSISSTKQVIDVSTDGDGNVGANQVTAANGAITAGIDQINCLGIGAGANCNFNRGTGSFSVTVATFADFETALERKIIREVTVPEPGTLAILSLGLAALVSTRRKVAGWMGARGSLVG